MIINLCQARFWRNRGGAKFWGGRASRANDLWWQHFCFIYVFYQRPVTRPMRPFASIFHPCILASTSRGDGGGERVVLNNDLRCANISSLFLSWVSTWVYTSMKRTCEDLRSRPPFQLTPPLSALLLRRTRKRDPIQVPKDILSSEWNIYSWYRYRFFPRAEWGMREREFALWELIRSLNVYAPPPPLRFLSPSSRLEGSCESFLSRGGIRREISKQRGIIYTWLFRA